MKDRIISMLYGENDSGSTSTHMELIRPRSRYSRYSGIRPALKYIVNIRMKAKRLRPFSSFRASGYAARIVMIMPITVNRTVIQIV